MARYYFKDDSFSNVSMKSSIDCFVVKSCLLSLCSVLLLKERKDMVRNRRGFTNSQCFAFFSCPMTCHCCCCSCCCCREEGSGSACDHDTELYGALY